MRIATLTLWIFAAMAVASGGSPLAMPEILATRQPNFAIPFRIERSEDPAWQPVEAQLYVSTDRGKNWRLYAKVPAAQGRFPFRAGGDGEFWFAIRTANRWGRVRPESIAAPGLRILVDTKPPALKLAAETRRDGQVAVRWEIEEPNVKPGSFQIVYRPSPTEPWQAVPLPDFAQRGETVFWPKPGSSDLMIRAEVSDTAGNPASANARVQLEPGAGPQPAEGAVAVAIHPPIGRNYGSGNRSLDDGPALAVAAPADRSQPVSPKNDEGWAEHPRMVRSKTFELEYDVESVGSSGVGRVELWGTRDGGRAWQRFAVDDDNQSPLRVTVEEEGVYGFRVVVTNGVGIGGRPPAAGDPPDLSIDVDATKPVARITSAEQGMESETGRLIISWQADDRRLAARPISLFFREKSEEPWITLAAGLENTGRYAWPIDRRAPPQAFLRLEVRDEAGNVGVDEPAEPVVLDQSRPTVRIRSVRPVEEK